MNKTMIDLLNNLIEVVGLIDENLGSNFSLETIKTSNSFNEKMDVLNKLYASLAEQDKNDFYNILDEEFAEDPSMHIYLLSILSYRVHSDEILERVADIIVSSNLDIYQSVFLELQIAYEIFGNSNHGDMYQLRRKLHSRNIKKYCETTEIPQNYVPYLNRNKNRLVVITEQVLELNHAPSKIILEQCYTLEKEFGMEILLITSPIRESNNNEILWFNSGIENSISYLDGNHIVAYRDGEMLYKQADLNNEFIILYKEVPIRGKQINFEANNENSLKLLMHQIYEFNPLFVYDMGSIHPLAGACSSFTTVVSMAMSYGYPVSDAPILLSLTQNGDYTEEKSEVTIVDGCNQVVLKDSFIFTIDKPVNPQYRTTFGLSENIFLIALVGNRLKEELSNEFVSMLKQVMHSDNEIDILLIGGYPEYETRFSDLIFKDRIHYMGYQEELADIISISDIYLNPPRKGGGTSALISLYAGVPVITLPEGDVAGNVGADFVCKDYDEIIATITKYKQNIEFYKKQRTKGIDQTHRLTDLAGKLKNNINRIEETILLLEGKTTSEY